MQNQTGRVDIGETGVEVAESLSDSVVLMVMLSLGGVGGQRRQQRWEIQDRIVGDELCHGREVMVVVDDPLGQGWARRRGWRGRQGEGCAFGRGISTSTGILGWDFIVLVDDLERVLESAATAADGHANGLRDDGRHAASGGCTCCCCEGDHVKRIIGIGGEGAMEGAAVMLYTPVCDG
jgi:hypothetical protein